MDGKQGVGRPDSAFVALFQRASDSAGQMERVGELFDELLPATAAAMGRLLHTELVFERGETSRASLNAACYAHGELIRAVYHATGWDCPLVLFAERRLPNAVLELMFGATDVAYLTSDTFDPEGTTGEVAQKMVTLLAQQLETAARDLGIGTLEQRALEVPENADPIARSDFDMIAVTLNCEQFGGRAFEFLLPSRGLVDADDMHAGGTGGPSPEDERWTAQLNKRLLATAMSLDAYVDGPKMTLEQLMALAPGSLITLPAGELENVRVGHDGVTALRGSLVQSGGVYSVDVDAYVLPDDDDPAV